MILLRNPDAAGAPSTSLVARITATIVGTGLTILVLVAALDEATRSLVI